MKMSVRISICIGASLLFMTTFFLVAGAHAQELGAAKPFVAFAANELIVEDYAAAQGDVGAWDVIGFPPGVIDGQVVEGAEAMVVREAAIAAFDSFGNGCGNAIQISPNLGGLSLPPGDYCVDGDATLNGILYLDGPVGARWVLLISGYLDVVHGSSVRAVGQEGHDYGAAWGCGLWWRVGSWVNMGATDGAFLGTVLTGGGAVLDDALLYGRVLAPWGNVYLHNAVTSVAACLEQPTEPDAGPPLDAGTPDAGASECAPMTIEATVGECTYTCNATAR